MENKNTSNINVEIQERLFSLQDTEYQKFQAGLIPTIDPEFIVGVRTPELRKLAKEFSKRTDITDFLADLPHKYYEENNLHGYIIEQIKDYESCVSEVNRFLPYVDNWATCDTMRPKIFAKKKENKEKLLKEIDLWLASDKTYTIRFGIGMLLSFYLDEDFQPEQAEAVSAIRSDEYYVNMMIAWYFATALAKQYEIVLPYITEKRLPVWVHNKTIQKAVESYRITAEQKEFLRTLRVKK